jgi:hypothetical protein
MPARLSVFFAAALLLTGCGKKPETAVSVMPQAVAETTTNQSPSVSNTTTVNVTNAVAAPDLKQLNRALRAWVLRNQRRPKSFAEFAATANIQIPPPPAGKKYALGQHMHILLVNQ